MGLSVDEAFDLADRNLRERSSPPKFAPFKNGIYRAAAAGDDGRGLNTRHPSVVTATDKVHRAMEAAPRIREAGEQRLKTPAVDRMKSSLTPLTFARNAMVAGQAGG